MSQRQLAVRAVALLSATAGALAPVADLAAKRRRRRRDNDDDDDDGTLRSRLRRREREDDDDDDVGRFRLNRKSRRSEDKDEDEPGSRSGRQNKRSDDTDEDSGGGDRESGASGQQSILGDLNLEGIIEERVSNALSRGGGGGGEDEPNIIVSEDGESLVVLTDNVEFAGDEFGFEVETDGISYSAGDSAAGGGDVDQDFTS